MKLILGLILLLVGAAVALTGLGIAISHINELYQSNLTDALNQPDNAEQTQASAILHGALIGLAGAVPMVIGTVLVKSVLFRKLTRPRSKS